MSIPYILNSTMSVQYILNSDENREMSMRRVTSTSQSMLATSTYIPECESVGDLQYENENGDRDGHGAREKSI